MSSTSQQQLITIALKNLETFKPQECPICARSIDSNEVVEELKRKISNEVANSINEARDSKRKIELEKAQLEKTSEDLVILIKIVDSSEVAFKQATEEMRKILPELDENTLDNIPKEWENQINEISSQISVLRSEQNTLADTVNRVSQIQSELNSLQKSLQKSVGIALEGPKLIQRINETLAAQDQEIGELSDSTSIDTLRKNLSAQWIF